MDTGSEPCTRDVIVVGGSAGSVEPLRRLAAALPPELPAALFVVVHRAAEGPTHLGQILGGAGPLPASVAQDGAAFVRGTIYVAPPDRHLLLGAGHMHVRRGPRENRTRPAIDVLFRSAAVSCSVRVIGVLLSGLLDDGTAGLQAIRRCGGVGVVQDPRDALCPDMPRSAITHGLADHVEPAGGLARLLGALTRQPCPQPVQPPDQLRMETLIAAQELVMAPDQQELGQLAPLTCPECHGSLYAIADRDMLRFRCHTGHAFSAESLHDAQAEAWEQTLYNALRVQEEQIALVRRIASEARQRAAVRHADDIERRLQSYEEGAAIIRQLLARGRGVTGPAQTEASHAGSAAQDELLRDLP